MTIQTKSSIPRIALIPLCFVAGALCSLIATLYFFHTPPASIVTMNWGDGKYGKAFYGVEVTLTPTDNASFSVKGRVLLGRGNGHVLELGEIAQVASHWEAVEKFGGMFAEQVVRQRYNKGAIDHLFTLAAFTKSLVISAVIKLFL